MDDEWVWVGDQVGGHYEKIERPVPGVGVLIGQGPPTSDVDALRARIRTLEGALREAEWAYDGEENPRFCPACHGKEPSHHEACELKAALDGGAE